MCIVANDRPTIDFPLTRSRWAVIHFVYLGISCRSQLLEYERLRCTVPFYMVSMTGEANIHAQMVTCRMGVGTENKRFYITLIKTERTGGHMRSHPMRRTFVQ